MIHFIFAGTRNGRGGGLTAWKSLLSGFGAPVMLHYPSDAAELWQGFDFPNLTHKIHQGWKTWENREYKPYDDSCRDFDDSGFAAGDQVVFDSIEAMRQLTVKLLARGCRLYLHMQTPERILRRNPLASVRDVYRYRKLEKLICISRFLEKKVCESPLGKLCFAPVKRQIVVHGLDFPAEDIPAQVAGQVCFFGRFDGYKHPLFLEKLDMPVRYIGSVRGCAHPQAIPAERDMGWMNVDEAAASGDIFIFPSVNEAFGLAIIEMMARGKIVICFNSGAFPEIVTDGENGFLIPPFDVNAAKAVIKRLHAKPELAEKIRNNASASARSTYSKSAYQEHFLQALQS